MNVLGSATFFSTPPSTMTADLTSKVEAFAINKEAMERDYVVSIQLGARHSLYMERWLSVMGEYATLPV